MPQASWRAGPFPDRDGRAWTEGRAGRPQERHRPAHPLRQVCRPLPGALEAPWHQQRRLHPHHRAPPHRSRPEDSPGSLGQGPDLPVRLQGQLLRRMRKILHRQGSPGRMLPRLRQKGRCPRGEELLLQDEPVPAAPHRPHQRKPGLHPPRKPPPGDPRLPEAAP